MIVCPKKTLSHLVNCCMPLDNKCRIGPLAGAPTRVRWSSALRLNRDSSLKDYTSPVCHTQVARGRQKSSRHCL
ncbi:hypothetical protein TNCV_3757211 [Trichonephila clavipes]|nr:hypothetical protein TNCV_3757211 [Trichonephila clavipes]